MRKAMWVATSGLLVLVDASTAWGQSSGAIITSDGTELEEIVVTAQKRETDLQKTAISMQVYAGETLKQQGKKRLDEIMGGVVGVQSQDSQLGSSFSIRGVDTGNTGGPQTNPGATVAILVDGVYQPRTEVLRGGGLDVARVEVMRGTQSTNVGPGAIAGAVSVVSNQPVFDYQANGSIEVGNYDKRALEGVLNVPLASDQALRFAYYNSKRDGYISSNAGNEDLQQVRGKYRWRPNENLNAVLTAEHQSIAGNGVSAGVLTYSGYWEPYDSSRSYLSTMGSPPLFGYVNNDVTFRERSNPWDDGYPADVWPNNPFRDTQISTYSANIEWNAGIGIVTVIPSVQKAKIDTVEPPRGGQYGTEHNSQDTRQFEARIASPFFSKLQWLGGVYYYYTDEPRTSARVTSPGVVAPPNICPPGNSYCYSWNDTQENSLTSKAVFGSLTYPVIDSVRLLGSARYSRDEKVNTASAAVNGTVTGPTVPYVYGTVEGEWDAVTYRAGVEYDVLPQSMLYATYATGYQPGAAVYFALYGPPSATVSAKNTSDQITLGIKNKLFDNRLLLNVEAFLLKFKNRPFNDPTTYNVPGSADSCATFGTSGLVVGANLGCINPNVSTVIMPNQKSQGVDLEVSFLATAADRIDATFEYLAATYGANPNAPSYTTAQALAAAGIANPTAAQTDAANALLGGYDALVGSYKGTVLQNAPKYSGNLSYGHTFTFAGGSSLVPRINMQYKDKYWAQGGGIAPAGFTSATTALAKGSLVRQDAYSVFDFYTTWTNANGKFGATAYVKNIENEAVQTNITGENGVTYISLNAPRTFGVIFNASF